MSNRPRLTLAALWLIVPTLLVFIDVATQAEYQVDYWTHLRQGRLIAELGEIPTTDRITYTIHGRPVLNQNWLGQLFLYELFELGGMPLTQFVAALIYAGSIALVTAVAYARSQNARAAAVAAILAAACAWTNFSIRTQTFGIACFAIVAAALWLWPRRAWWPLLLLAPVQIIWANVHGTFPLGVVLCLVFAAGRGLDSLKDGWRAALADDLVQKSLIAAAVLGAVSFVNPDPAQTLGYLDQNVSRSVQRGVSEWQPPSLNELSGRIFFLSVALAMVALNRSGRPASWLELLLLVVFFLLGEKAIRMIVWWGFIAAPILAPQLAAWMDRVAASGEQNAAAEDDESSAMNWVMLGLFALVLVFSTPWTKQHNPLLSPVRKQAVFSMEPRAATQALVDRKATGNIFSSWGAYVSWFLPEAYISQDARIDMFPDEIWNEFTLVGNAGPGWEEVLDRDHVNWVMWPTREGDRLADALSSSGRWRLVHRDDTAIVFERIDHLPDVPPDSLPRPSPPLAPPAFLPAATTPEPTPIGAGAP